MGWFTKKDYAMPAGHPMSWTALDVKHWLKHCQAEGNGVKQAMATIDGQLLCSMTYDDLRRTVRGTPQPKLLAALNSLRTAWNLPLMSQQARTSEPVTAVPLPAPASASVEGDALPAPTAAAPLPLEPELPTTVTAVPMAYHDAGAAPEAALSLTEAPSFSAQLAEAALQPAEPLSSNKPMGSTPASEGDLAIPSEPVQETLEEAAPQQPMFDSAPLTPTHQYEDEQALLAEADDTAADADALSIEDFIVDDMTQLEITDRVTEESAVEAAQPFHHLMQNVQGVVDWAQVLQPYTELGTTPTTVVGYLDGLGKGVGGGLALAAGLQPAYGNVFGAAMKLDSTAMHAAVERDNCYKASTLAADTLRIMDIAWRRHSTAANQGGTLPASLLDVDALVQICEHLYVLDSVVAAFSGQGWLVEVCCNERIKERFDAAHNGVVDAMKALGLDQLHGIKPMSRGDYRDLTRPVRRLLRQHGNGSITAGLMQLKAASGESEAVKELANLLELNRQEGSRLLLAELAALPTDAGLDVDVYYKSLVMGDNAGTDHHGVFDWYVRDEGADFIDANRFHHVLMDLGLLDGKSEQEAQAYVAASFKAADTRGEGVLSRDAFCAYYATLTTSKARQQLRARMGIAVEDELRSVFSSFASFGSRVEVQDIDNARFFKLTKDCGLTSSNLTSTDVDIIFAKAKAKGARRMNFEQFLSAISMCADKKGLSLEDAVRKVLLAGGPLVHATKPDTVRLHDDKSTYTGVYAKGGPKAVDPPKNDLSSFLDRSEADVRGVKKAQVAAKAASNIKQPPLSARKPPMSTAMSPDVLRTSMAPGSLMGAGNSPHMVSVSRRQSTGGDLRDMFNAFATFGSTTQSGNGRIEMDSSRFQKLCRECRLFDEPGKSRGGFNNSRADLIFAKVKQQGHNKITYAEFERALQLVAEAKAMSVMDVAAGICSSDGPLLTRMVQG